MDPAMDWKPPELENKTALRSSLAHGWVPEPSTRGTWSILYSALFTLFLCVYSAVHLNVPPSRQQWSYVARKATWMVVALFAPEVVLFIAYLQRSLALKLARNLNADRPKGKLGYDLTFCFFVIQGGLVVDVENTYSSPNQLTLSPDGVLLLADHGYWLEIPTTVIKDKSNANLLSKVLACGQVTWMVIQVIVRKTAGYSIPLVELHILCYVVSALSTYLLWMKKPLDVNVPISVNERSFGTNSSSTKCLQEMLRHMVELDQRGNGRFDEESEKRIEPGAMLLPQTAPDLPLHWLSPRPGNLRNRILNTIIPILLFATHGAVHLIAWNMHFPSTTEMLLWRISAVISIVGSLSAPVILSFVAALTDSQEGVSRTDAFLYLLWTPDQPRSTTRALRFGAAAILPFFLAARLFLFIETFISLREMPMECYVTVPWAVGLPHI